MARISWLCFSLTASLSAAAAAPRTLMEWNFEHDREGWLGQNHLAEVQVADGALTARAIDWDPFLVGPLFEVPARPWQWLEVRLKSDVEGTAEFFWTNTTDSPYGGFSPGKETPFQIVGDNEWHTYRVVPYWHAEKKIIRLRLDFPGGQARGRFAVDFIRLVDPEEETEPVPATFDFADGLQGWRGPEGLADLRAEEGELRLRVEDPTALLQGPRVAVEAETHPFLTLRLAASAGESAAAYFVSRGVNGLHRFDFPLKGDGQWHTYNLDLGAHGSYRDEILALALRPTNAPGAEVRLDSLALAEEPQGRPELEILYFGLDRPLNRAGVPAKLLATVRNVGGEPTPPLVPHIQVPEGITLGTREPEPQVLPFGVDETFEWEVTAPQPVEAEAVVTVGGENIVPVKATAVLEFTARPEVPQADYIPEPQPVKSDYRVGVYYFPGWASGGNWAPILGYRERMPLLGWYQEGLPEVADWHIKWAVEHGIEFFIYDWYWNQGSRSLEHALHDGFFRAKYQHLLDFCLLWANHNPPFQPKDPARKVEEATQDLLNVTDYWLENYFHRDNYTKVEGKPVVVIFSPWRIRDDLGHENVAAAFERMRQKCRAAGLAGLYLVACTGGTGELQALREEGYDAVSGYNWPGAGMTEADGRRAPFETILPGYQKGWQDIVDADVIKLIPPVSGGWDSRPWHGDGALVRFGRTPENFERHLADTKAFLDAQEQEPKLKMCFIEAWNEWGEGSYIEPHKEFGFGYLDAIRRVFTDAPRDHADLVPEDVGLGPYDVPAPAYRTAWEFEVDGEGWGGMMQVSDVRVEDGALCVRTSGRDPALSGALLRAPAARYPFLETRIKASHDFSAQLFWATTTSPISEPNSVHFDVVGDGEWHEYRVRLADNPRWRGVIRSLRFDLGVQPDVEVAMDYFRLVGEGEAGD